MSILAIWHSWRARRRAVAMIAPLVAASRQRLGPIPDHVWLQPYPLGFMTMLISLVAVSATRGRLVGERLGLAQILAWHELSGVNDDQVGEQILLLSAQRDSDFMAGCADAASFHAACREGWSATPAGSFAQLPDGLADDPVWQDPWPSVADGSSRVDELWTLFFEARAVGRHAAMGMER